VIAAKFQWSERSAQGFMNVYARFKSAKIADLPIRLTALYRLASPSTPEEVRQAAVARAEAGEEITAEGAQALTVAERRKTVRASKQIVESAKKADEVISVRATEKDPRGRKPKGSAPREKLAEAVGVSEATVQRAERHVETAGRFQLFAAS
jgi:hypothetical protein